MSGGLISTFIVTCDLRLLCILVWMDSRLFDDNAIMRLRSILFDVDIALASRSIRSLFENRNQTFQLSRVSRAKVRKRKMTRGQQET